MFGAALFDDFSLPRGFLLSRNKPSLRDSANTKYKYYFGELKETKMRSAGLFDDLPVFAG